MAQAKRKTATKTKKATRQNQARRQATIRTHKQQAVDNREKMHVYIVTAMAMIAGILLCANAAMMMA
ncbi:hypothetical protein IJH26_01255 [Candidatus Saccharibacteria bacterium]|nr:hypothetical protein [Candidatus Saccharibacteria bacterium]MBQ3476122.1 hypothetical protein [Candidatus Saccharibacteria bacterium]